MAMPFDVPTVPVPAEPLPPLPVRGSLWDHQDKTLRRSSSLAAFMFAHDPGLGKTLSVIAESGLLFEQGEIDTVVVVAPNRVHAQWVQKQFPRWASFPFRAWLWPKGGLASQKRAAIFEEALRVPLVKPRLRVFAFNFEAVRIPPRAKKLPEAILLIDRIMQTSTRGVYFVVDEIHRIKDFSAQQSRGVQRYGRQGVLPAKVRRGLTGTPVLQGVHDLFGQYAFLDLNIIREPNFWSFRSNFCKTRPVPDRPNAQIITGAKNEAILMQRIAPFTSRVIDRDALDMPDQVFERFDVEMEPAQRKAYDQMETLMLAGLKTPDGMGQVITAKIVLTQMQKLQQLASGFVMDEDRGVHWLSDAKLEAVREVVSDLGGEPVVIWAPFIPLLERLEFVFGEEGTRFRSLADIEVWKKKGGALIANPASGGVGVDGMQWSHRSFYMANTFSLEHRLQSIKRTHRGDQKEICFYTDFCAAESIDHEVLDALAAKQDIGSMTIDRLRMLLLDKKKVAA